MNGTFNVVSYAPGGFPLKDSMLVLLLSYAGTFWSVYLKAIWGLASEMEQGKVFGTSEGLREPGQTVVAFLCLSVLGFAVNEQGFKVILRINAVAFTLILSGGIEVIQTVSIVITFPYLFILILIGINLIIALKRKGN